MRQDFRTPNITASTTEGKLQQLQSFLFQHIQQLNWAAGYLEAKSEQALAQAAGKAGAATGGQQSPKSTFNSIKSLIIKSADIVESYYEQINTRLRGVYVAQSDFGIYREETAAEIDANAKGITQVYENLQTVTETVEGLHNSQLETDAYIRTGLLDYGEDGSPVYGVEVGQVNSIDGEEVFDRMARFTAGKLSFFDAHDVEVAYISDYKLHITNAQILGRLVIGTMELDPSDGLIIRDIGGEEA